MFMYFDFTIMKQIIRLPAVSLHTSGYIFTFFFRDLNCKTNKKVLLFLATSGAAGTTAKMDVMCIYIQTLTSLTWLYKDDLLDHSLLNFARHSQAEREFRLSERAYSITRGRTGTKQSLQNKRRHNNSLSLSSFIFVITYYGGKVIAIHYVF